MTLFEQAQQELRLLESHWISLLSWLAENTGIAAADLVKAWSADAYYTASGRLASATKKAAGAQWTLLHFVDFGSYIHLASGQSTELARLGNPPRDWSAQINRQMTDEGLVAFRNHLQHANRFALLPPAEQQRGIGLLRAQRALLVTWWPDCPVKPQTTPVETPLRAALRALGPRPDDALPLIEGLGLRPIRNARNLIKRTGVPTPITEQLKHHLSALYAVGEVALGPVRAAVYLACMENWQQRSAKREPVRRRVAKALRERGAEEQRVIIFVDAEGKATEAEFVLPRVRAGQGVGIVRAFVSLTDPTRHHIDLLTALSAEGVDDLPALARRWIDAFSVERVTTSFYTEFRELRDRLIDDLLANNAKNPALKSAGNDRDFGLKLQAFGTRQLSRILFLWFLQQKRWLGGSNPNDGAPNFLTDLFRDAVSAGDNYFADVLTPLCFEGLGTRQGPKRKTAIERFGGLPYLGGGIFSLGANEFEAQLFGLNDDGERTCRVVLSNDLFDPRRDEAEGKGRRRTVLGLLRGYRFTTQESTPDDQSIDPDPELLGKVFENLYQSDERHKSGAYYTPREIVQFMCRRTLDGYLREQTGVAQETLDWLREEAIDWSFSDRKLKQPESDDLITALERVRVLDPAVGSGAFLLTMMHEIVTLRRGIEQSELDKDVSAGSIDVAEWKRRVATSSLYGVDINPMAVEICHLRLWLSIIVDLEISAFSQVPALPNLDFRIVAGDSLIDRMGEEPFFESLPRPDPNTFDMIVHAEVKSLQRTLDGRMDKFRLAEGDPDSDAKRQRELRKKIRESQVAIAKVQVEQALGHARQHVKELAKPKAKKPTAKQVKQAEEKVTHLEALLAGLHHDAPSQKPFLWPVNFHEVFASDPGGFDIVLANPPYVRQEDLDPIDQQAYAHAFADVHTGTADLLVYFYARAHQVLRANGQLAFICSDKFMRADFGAGLRRFLTERFKLIDLIDFAHLPVFDADTMPLVLTAENSRPHEAHCVRFARLREPIRISIIRAERAVNVSSVREELRDLDALLAECTISDLPQERLGVGVWAPTHRLLMDFFDELCRHSPTLAQLLGSVASTYGIKTGLNPAYVVTADVRERLIAQDAASGGVLKRWMRGQDIQRWTAKQSERWILLLASSSDADSVNPWRNAKKRQDAERLFKQSLPAVYKHMSQFKEFESNGKLVGLLHRSDQGAYWWELRACTYYSDFKKPKMVWKDIAYKPEFAWDETESYYGNTAFFSAAAPKWLVAICNSVPFAWLASMKLFEAKDAYYRWLPSDLAALPVPDVTSDEKVILADLVDSASRTANAGTIERELDSIAFRLYGFGLAERQLVESWHAARVMAETVGSVMAHQDESDNDED